MKLNLKRAVVGLTMAVCLFSLSACGAASNKSQGIDADMKAQLDRFPSPRIWSCTPVSRIKTAIR